MSSGIKELLLNSEPRRFYYFGTQTFSTGREPLFFGDEFMNEFIYLFIYFIHFSLMKSISDIYLLNKFFESLAMHVVEYSIWSSYLSLALMIVVGMYL